MVGRAQQRCRRAGLRCSAALLLQFAYLYTLPTFEGRPAGSTTQPRMPQFSVIIPARNEELLLPRCLEALRVAESAATGTVEIIVVLNRCTDRTESIARAAGCRTVQCDKKNLAAIRNAGAAVAAGMLLVTVDADSCVAPNTLRAIEVALADDTIVGGGVSILPERWSLGILATGCILLPIALWYGISGGLFFCRKSDFEEIGGFDESLASVEDIDFAKRLKRLGKTRRQRFITLWRSPILTSCRKFDRFGDWHFVLRPWLTWSLLKGRNQAAADQVWYDFER